MNVLLNTPGLMELNVLMTIPISLRSDKNLLLTIGFSRGLPVPIVQRYTTNFVHQCLMFLV